MRTEPILVTGIAQFDHLPVKLATWSQYKTKGVRGLEDARDTYFPYVPAHFEDCQHEGATQHNKLAKLPSWRTEMKGVLLLLTDKFAARHFKRLHSIGFHLFSLCPHQEEETRKYV